MSNKQVIDKLTPEQEAQFPVYVDKWIKRGIATASATPEETEGIIRNYRKELLSMRDDVPNMVFKNPIECWVACCLIEQNVTLDNLRTEVRDVFHGNPKKFTIPKAILPFNDISLISTFAFYDFMQNVLNIEFEPDLKRKYEIWEATHKLWAIYPLENVTIICDHPTEVHINDAKQLHRDGGPAVRFEGEGEFEIYCLNNVTVPKYIAVTPAQDLSLEDYNKETNADVKAEFLRKVGIERFLELGKLMDTYKNYDQEEHSWWWKSEYELYDMKALYPNLQSAPYIKMLNQTTGIWHLEGVSPSCKKLSAALKERFNGREMKIVNVA
jgi:hypothetical protein